MVQMLLAIGFYVICLIIHNKKSTSPDAKDAIFRIVLYFAVFATVVVLPCNIVIFFVLNVPPWFTLDKILSIFFAGLFCLLVSLVIELWILVIRHRYHKSKSLDP
ncbi:MAG: hypothetical protein ACFFCS_28560 [Candidatus Hodarchaeota archaeon]